LVTREGELVPGTVQPEHEQITLPSALWADPDVRWLTGAHQAEGHTYFIRERYEELLWWLLLPSLQALAGQNVPTVAAAAALSGAVESLLAFAEATGYRIDDLAGPNQESEKLSRRRSSAREIAEAKNHKAEPEKL
jgi:hypothetical protein